MTGDAPVLSGASIEDDSVSGIAVLEFTITSILSRPIQHHQREQQRQIQDRRLQELTGTSFGLGRNRSELHRCHAQAAPQESAAQQSSSAKVEPSAHAEQGWSQRHRYQGQRVRYNRADG